MGRAGACEVTEVVISPATPAGQVDEYGSSVGSATDTSTSSNPLCSAASTIRGSAGRRPVRAVRACRPLLASESRRPRPPRAPRRACRCPPSSSRRRRCRPHGLLQGGRGVQARILPCRCGDPVTELVGFLHVVRGKQIVWPSLFSSPSRSHSASRLCGSSPAVGSSRNSTEGRWKIARATMSRCAMPPERA